MAGIKNLQSTTYKQDGPIKAVIDRFPEKFVISSGNSSNHNAGNHNPNGGPDHPTNSMSKTSARHSSYQQLQKGNADNNHSSNSNTQLKREQHTRNMTEHRQDKHQLGGDSSAQFAAAEGDS